MDYIGTRENIIRFVTSTNNRLPFTTQDNFYRFSAIHEYFQWNPAVVSTQINLNPRLIAANLGQNTVVFFRREINGSSLFVDWIQICKICGTYLNVSAHIRRNVREC